MNAETLKTITNWAESIGAIILTIIALIILIKIFIKKTDKNKNGKIEKGEIEEADIQFCKALLKDSILTIATGLKINGGITGKNAYKLMLEQVKKSKKIFENLEGENKQWWEEQQKELILEETEEEEEKDNLKLQEQEFNYPHSYPHSYPQKKIDKNR